jgi:MFS family permease
MELRSKPAARLPAVVRRLGWVSLLTDAASEMIYPLLPVILRSIGGGAAWLGVMEGVAESLSAFVKWGAGAASDGRARKPFVVAGYGIATFARPLLSLVVAPWQVVVVRTLDRFGKGIRSAPRDAILAQAVEPARRGAAFGFHRMMDNAGAVVGPLIAFALARFAHLEPRAIFACAIVPGLLALATLVLGVREPPETKAKTPEDPLARAPRPPLPRAARAYLAVVALFSLGASADSFLMLRLADLKLDPALLPIAWLSLNGAKAATNVPGGRLSDLWGHRRTLAVAWILYAAAYAALPLTQSIAVTWLLILGYGVYYGLSEGGEKALLADLVPPESRGRAFGAMHAVTGFAVLPANALFGALYAAHPAWAFWTSASFAGLAATALVASKPGPARGT